MGNYFNQNVEKYLSSSVRGQGDFQSFSGPDISAFIYLPLITKSSINGNQSNKSKLFAEIQTISISSTRSISPVRVLGRSSPLSYTRGARTVAGTLVFAHVNKDAFQEVYDQDVLEATIGSSTSLVSDQLPPFSIILSAVNEKGGAAMQAIHGITLVNYGTTYSIDDLYTEVVYSYVATDLTPLINTTVSLARTAWNNKVDEDSYPTISKLIQDSMGEAYGSLEQYRNRARRYDDNIII